MRRILCGWVAALGWIGVASAQPANVSDDLKHGKFAPGSTIDVIVQYRHDVSQGDEQKMTHKGGVLKSELPLIRGAAYTVPADQLTQIADDPQVQFVATDRPLMSADYSGAPDYGWMAVLGVSPGGSVPTMDGSGIGIAVLDSGINNAPDLNGTVGAGKPRVVYAESFVPKEPNGDRYGHGTHVAGLIAGNGKQSNNSAYLMRGLAPGATLVDLKVLDGQGRGTDSQVIAAIQRAMQLQSQYNIRVINLSLGRPVQEACANDLLCQAVAQAWQAGIVVVVAAGNEGRNNSAGTNGYATITVPGNSPSVITVGAMNTMGTPQRSDDKMASYSSKGPTLIDHIVKPDLVAPGNQAVSLRSIASYLDQNAPTLPGAITKTAAYFTLCGTSMAAPMVSGAAALLLQKNPRLTPD
jgi:serine protease AprX